MNCHETKERLAEGRESAAVRRHVAGCADCAAFRHELEAGGREIADAFLAVGPGPGFEERVGARLVETEIAARPPGPRSRITALAAAALLPLALATAAWLALFRPGEEASHPAPPAPPAPAGRQVVVTEPEQDNPLIVVVRGGRAAGPTTIDLHFAGDARHVPVPAQAFDALLHAFARGARRAEVTVEPGVPGRDVTALVDALERAGYAWDLLRRRP